ncbi:probable aspartic proteinase GIP2 [Oryza brachyantha]|uniref:Peptidase A1 domain-containing protein n=1 Tax=Oryza brachyantha TaxID=4533 RepID=J3M707_ORYBR|nr:probable aspartic proteinase GIP2 [Oryza brachyantha]
MTRLRGSPLAVAAGALLLLLVLGSPRCAAASGGGSAVVLPVNKDDATQQYVTVFRQRTPQVPVKAVLDLAGAMLWVDCDAGYVSSSYAGVPCGSKPCRLLKNAGCAVSCLDAPSSGCLNGTCAEFPKNTVTSVSTAGNVLTDVLSLPTTFRPAPGPLATAPAFLFTCGRTFLTEGLAAGATGMVSLSRARFALPTQLAGTFRLPRKFALCLPAASAAGFVVFGDAPYTFQPGVDLSKFLTYTPLLVNPVSTAPYGRKDKSTKYFIGETTIQLNGRVWREKPTDYFVGLTGIRVNGRAVPLNATLLAIDRKGVGGTRLSTVSPYTVLERSIHQAVTGAFAKEMGEIPRAPAVEPFELCYDGSKVVGGARAVLPAIELQLQSTAAPWVVLGASSMVAAGKGGALCLGVVDGGTEPQTSVVIGGRMMEETLLEFDLEGSRLGFSSYLPSRHTTCDNFRLG